MPTRAPLGDRLTYRPPEVAALTGASKAFVYKLIAEGKLPAKRMGRAVFVTRADLLAYLDQLDAA